MACAASTTAAPSGTTSGGGGGQRDSGRRYWGKYRGKVIENIDPLFQGRILADVPSVPGSLTNWALPCTPYAGPDVGFYAIPPIDANVWIEYEGGDPGYPVWVGCFWGPTDILHVPLPPPPEVKVFKTDFITLVMNDLPGIGGFTLECLPPAVAVPLSMKFDTSGITISCPESTIKMTPASITLSLPPAEINMLPASITVTVPESVIELTPETLSLAVPASSATLTTVAIAIDAPETAIAGETNITGALTVEGAVDIAGALAVEGAVDIAGGLAIEGGGTIDGTPIL